MKMKVKKAELILGVLLGAQIIFLLYCNFFLQPKNIDSDMARLYVHAIEVFRNHSLYIPDWSYVTTAEWDCSLLFAAPVYGITNNIYASFAVSNMLFLAIWIGTIFKLFSGGGVEKSYIRPLAVLNLILVPYGIGMLSYFNMLFFNGAQYVIKALVPLMLVCILIQILEQKKWNIRNVLFGLLYLFFLMLTTASSGIYVFLCGVLPCLAACFLWESVVKNNKMPRYFYLCAAMTAVAVAVGLYVNIKLGVNPKGSAMKFCVVPGELHDNIVSCFWGIYELFGGVTYWDTDIMSYQGILVMLRMVFTTVLIVGGLTAAKRILTGKQADRMEVMLLSITGMNLLVLCLCSGLRRSGGLFEFRYHLIGIIPVMIVTVKRLITYCQTAEKKKKRLIGIVGGILFAALLLDSNMQVLKRESSRSELGNICSYAEELGIQRVYFDDYEGAEICRLLDREEHSEYFWFIDYGDGAYTGVFDYYKNYAGRPVDFENSMLVVYGTGNADTMVVAGTAFSFFAQEGDWGVYLRD